MVKSDINWIDHTFNFCAYLICDLVNILDLSYKEANIIYCLTNC